MIVLTVFTAFVPYFNQKKALSLGVSTAGSGVGMMIIPILLRFLFDNFSFSGAMLLYGKLDAFFWCNLSILLLMTSSHLYINVSYRCNMVQFPVWRINS